MANKMAEKKKNASQGSARSQPTEARARGAQKEQPVKSIREMARDEQQTRREESRQNSKTAAKSSSVAAREGRKEQAMRESKQPAPVRRDSKDASLVMRFRNSNAGRFVFDAYYELRHKVTWPTFDEARNMTIAVIALSVAVGLILGGLDFGLLKLFTLLSGGH